MISGLKDKIIYPFKVGAKSIIAASKSIASNPSLAACAMAADSAFLFTTGVILEHFGSKVVDTLLAIGTMMIPQSAASPDTFSPSFLGGPAQGLEARVIILLALMASGAFCAFCAMAGSSHWVSYRLAGKKIRYTRFIALFTRVSFAFFPLYLAYEALGYLHDFNTLAAERMPGLGYWDPSYLVPLIGISAAYLSLMSLSRLSEGTARGAILSGAKKGIIEMLSTISTLFPMIVVIYLVELASRQALRMGIYAQWAALLSFILMLTLIKTSLVIALDTSPENQLVRSDEHGAI